MKRFAIVLLSVFLILSCSFVPAFAQEADEAEEGFAAEEAEAAAESLDFTSPNALITVVFPKKDAVEAGKIAEIIVGFKNIGSKPFRVFNLRGNLYYSLDSRYTVENYTANYDLIVESNEHYSLPFNFRPHNSLDEGDFGFLGQINYIDAEGNYTTTFFNNTIRLVEFEAEHDFQAVFQIAFILAILFVGAFFGLNAVLPKKLKNKITNVNKKTISKEERTQGWLEGTAAGVKAPKEPLPRSPKPTLKKKN